MNTFLTGDVLETLKTLPNESVYCCVTSPPYFGLRDYGVEGQIGVEPTPDEYVNKLVNAFREVKRVLRKDGTLWVNLGDSYDAKNLIGIPWRVAFALQADGWFLRSDIVWDKPNAMPESTRDRPTKGHEYIFLLSKSKKYYYDADVIKEPAKWERWGKQTTKKRNPGTMWWVPDKTKEELTSRTTKNKRTVWRVPTKPFKGAHFAVFPPDLIRPCILAGSPIGGQVLDPFGGSGTVAMVANELGRDSIYIDLNPEYTEMAKVRQEGGTKL